LTPPSESQGTSISFLVSITRHALLLDDAIDKWLAARHANARGKHVFGTSFTSDESPPAGNRYTGLRFQITYVYVLWFVDRDQWDLPMYDDAHPFARERRMCDIMHCPGKTGEITLATLTKQWGRIGVFTPEMCSGTGDGGGENEGVGGIHALMERVNPSYVRKRCMLHLAWRVVDAGVETIERLRGTGTNSINVYLRDGMTWTRFKGICCKPRAEGGLNMHKEDSPPFKKLFSSAPPALMDQRPECYVDFLKWLVPRQSELAKLAVVDFATRDLHKKQFTEALASLQSQDDCVYRCLDMVLLARGLYMQYAMQKNSFIVDSTRTLQELINNARDLILSMRVDDEFLDCICVSKQELADSGFVETAEGHQSMTWVEVAIMLAPGHILMTSALCDQMLQAGLKYHTEVAKRMATHLQLTASNLLQASRPDP
jgi:hypothetical protein